jgi:hypothetical protein
MMAYLFVLLAVAVRFLPHPWAFTPVVGSLLFFGAHRSRRELWIALACLAASDVVLTKLVYAFPLGWDYLVTWLWYAAILGLGTGLRRRQKPLWLIAAALTGSISFFLLSNFTYWAYWKPFPMNLKGLEMAYAAGLPFFRRALEGDLVFTLAMFAAPFAFGALSGAIKQLGDTTAASYS